MTILKVIVLDDEFSEKMILTRNKIAQDFRDGNYGPEEAWGNDYATIYFVINQFMQDMGFFDD